MSKSFITGCDQNTEWQLPWFIENFKKHNDTPLVVADFGMSANMRYVAECMADHVTTIVNISGNKGWHLKTQALYNSDTYHTCWLDTDCEVIEDISDIFDYTMVAQLNMVQDRPWTKRRPPMWFNSGVVSVAGKPEILRKWTECCFEANVGDQEVLHAITEDPLYRIQVINELPHRFNTLRLDIEDGTQPNRISVMHWTGEKGNAIIREQMNECS